MDYQPRIGTFFLLVGLGLLMLFVVSAIGNEIKVNYLLLSIAAIFLGFIFRRKKPPPVQSGRFGSIRRASERNRQRRQEKMDKAQKK